MGGLKRRCLYLVVLFALLVSSILSGASAEGASAPGPANGLLPNLLQLVHLANVLPGLDHATLLGPTSAVNRLTVDIGLATSNQSGESDLLSDLYEPQSALYHQFLSPSQFNSEFHAASSTVAGTRAWLHASGLQESYVSGSGDLISVQGTIGQFASLLHTTFGDYKVGPYDFVANQTAPLVPAALGITDIAGLNTLQRMWSTSQVGPALAPKGHAATAGVSAITPSATPVSYVGSLVPQDLWGVYDAPSTDEGQGETAGVFEGGYSNGEVADLRVYEQRMGLPQVPVRVVSENEVTNPPVPNDNDILNATEADLDADALDGMAPKLSRMDMYYASTSLDPDFAIMFSDWANDPNGPKQMSNSFGECEADPTSTLLAKLPGIDYGVAALGNELQLLADPSFEQAVLEGRTVFSAAGDTGGSCPSVVLPVIGAGNGLIPQPLPTDQNYPCASVYVVCVGGTVVTTNGTTNLTATEAPTADLTTQPKRVDEQAWAFTGGGPAANVPRPSYQDGVSAIDLPCTEVVGPTLKEVPLGTVCRGVPDVAAMSGNGTEEGLLFGDNGYVINSNMLPSIEAGTSLATPIVAGLWARIQAASPQTAPGHYGGLGFANETFYAIGKGSEGNYSRDFYDVTSGDLPTGNFYERPTKGWDYASGWGGLDVANFIRDIDHNASLTPTHPLVDSAHASLTPIATCASVMSGPLGNAYDDTLSLSYPGPNDTALNVTRVTLEPSANGQELDVSIYGPGLSTVGPLNALGGFNFYVTWLYDGTTYFAGAEVDPGIQLPKTPATNSFPAPVSLPVGTVVYGDGIVSSALLPFSYTDRGSFANHTFTIEVPMADVGSPKPRSTLLYPFAFDTLPIGLPSGSAIDEVTAPQPGERVAIGGYC